MVLIHGGAQNAHTWDTVAIALDTPLVAPDLPGHGHSDGPAPGGRWRRRPPTAARSPRTAIDEPAPNADLVVGMSLGGLTVIVRSALPAQTSFAGSSWSTSPLVSLGRRPR